jgi:hypothetical protein
LSSALSKLLKDISAQKKAYHEKELSPEGEWSLFLRSFQLYDFMLDISNLLIPEFYFASLSSALLFGFDLTDLEPFNLEFDWRYPTTEEWEKGVGVVIEKTLNPCAVTLEEFLKSNIKEEYWPSIEETRLEKGYYGVSRYGYSYYDPATVREFLRNTTQLLIKKHPDLLQRKTALLTMAKTLEVPEDLAKNIHDRMEMVMTAHTECFILDYGMLDVSKLCVEAVHSEEYGVVPYINLDGEYREVEALTLDDLQYGCILDESLLDYCFLMPDETIYKSPGPPITPEIAPVIDTGIEDKLRRFRGRIAITAPAFSNYVRGDEAVDPAKCERTETWGELASDRYTLEYIAEQALRQLMPGLDPLKRRTYISAVLQLVGHRGKRHEWGYRVFKVASLDELKSWWLDYWSGQGLDRGVLEELYNRVEPFLEKFISKKVELGRKIRLQRLGIPID